MNSAVQPDTVQEPFKDLDRSGWVNRACNGGLKNMVVEHALDLCMLKDINSR